LDSRTLPGQNHGTFCGYLSDCPLAPWTVSCDFPTFPRNPVCRTWFSVAVNVGIF
jgi:hypothetical protein